ncbi:MAG: hypothetical protein ACYSUS_06100 [Planctomycetota bacterium]|jgi:hypothetical protein
METFEFFSFKGLMIWGTACLTLAIFCCFFSTRRSLFLKIFTVDEEEYNQANKDMPDGMLFKKSWRMFSLVFFSMAVISIILAIALKK